MLTAKISSTRRISLPKKVRQALAVKPGQRVHFLVEGAQAFLRPAGTASAEALAGSLGHCAASVQQPRDVLRAVKEAVARAAAHET
jgi:AbrB family looped-hinge helix DNA binding protein